MTFPSPRKNTYIALKLIINPLFWGDFNKGVGIREAIHLIGKPGVLFILSQNKCHVIRILPEVVLVLVEETRLARLTTSPAVKINGVATVTGLALSGLAFT